ncbi:MAG: hypothetical protein L0Y58_23555 [Verrucomicrobia subdivision 3 bacterium]|nr:hypothetical protein [Limisphaerales bacterium]
MPVIEMEAAKRVTPVIPRAAISRIGKQDIFMFVVAEPVAAAIRLHQILHLAAKATAGLFALCVHKANVIIRARREKLQSRTKSIRRRRHTHVLEGSALFVTGGTAVEPKTIAPDEVRGKEIKDGESRRIGKGDVIIVPNGVPHWFKQVDGPLL